MKKTKIDWCDCTENFIKGCTNNCEYCYARKQNDRFHFVKNWNEPEAFPAVLEHFKSKKPKSVFIDSMSDIGCWKDEWLEQIFQAMAKNPQHNYIALTKFNVNDIYPKLVRFYSEGYQFYLYIGKSVTTQRQADMLVENKEMTDFLSVEPILEPIDLTRCIGMTNAIIVGAETGNRKGKVVPQKEWIQNIVGLCDEMEKPVFMKESLREIMGGEFRQDLLVWNKRTGRKG